MGSSSLSGASRERLPKREGMGHTTCGDSEAPGELGDGFSNAGGGNSQGQGMR